nr:hypothetical protein [Tanacetum cinerariifolium]
MDVRKETQKPSTRALSRVDEDFKILCERVCTTDCHYIPAYSSEVFNEREFGEEKEYVMTKMNIASKIGLSMSRLI